MGLEFSTCKRGSGIFIECAHSKPQVPICGLLSLLGARGGGAGSQLLVVIRGFLIIFDRLIYKIRVLFCVSELGNLQNGM